MSSGNWSFSQRVTSFLLNNMSKEKCHVDARSGTRKIEVPFTQVANSILNDKKLSFKAKGVFAYIYSKPDGWDFSSYRISKDSTDGCDAIGTAVKELTNAGYLRTEKLNTGRVRYIITFKKKGVPVKAEEIRDVGF